MHVVFGKRAASFYWYQLLMSPEVLCAELFPLVCAAASSPKCEAVYSKLDCVSPPFGLENKSVFEPQPLRRFGRRLIHH